MEFRALVMTLDLIPAVIVFSLSSETRTLSFQKDHFGCPVKTTS